MVATAMIRKLKREPRPLSKKKGATNKQESSMIVTLEGPTEEIDKIREILD